MATADATHTLESLREQRNGLALGLFWLGGLLLLGSYWVNTGVWTNDALFGLVGGVLAVLMALAFRRSRPARLAAVGVAVVCGVYLVVRSVFHAQATPLSACFSLSGLLSLGLGGWFFLTPPPLPEREQEQERSLLLRQRKSAGMALLGVAGLLVVLTLWVVNQHGMTRFAMTVSLSVLAALALATAANQLSDPGKDKLQDRFVAVLHRGHSVWTIILLSLGGVALAAGLLSFRVGFWPALTTGFPETVGFLLAGLVLLGAGLYGTFVPPDKVTLPITRTLLLIVGGSLGLILTVMTAFRAWLWWDTNLLRETSAWSAWWLWLLIYVELFGLVVMFGSLYLAQADVRSNAVLRRTLFGYNTLCTGVLLLAMLVLINIMMYTALPYNFDWLKSRGLYALAPQSKNTLKSLKEQTTVYVVISQRSGVNPDVQNLLDNCRLYNSKLKVEYVSPDNDEIKYRELLDRYPKLKQARQAFHAADSSRGLLVVYGTEGEGVKLPHAFIPQSNLFEEGGRFADFKGEGLLMNELAFLVASEKKLQVYFTFGQGELLPTEDQFRADELERCGQLISVLKKRNYEVRTLAWMAPSKKALPTDVVTSKKTEEEAHEVPRDADVLVMANPQKKFPPDILAALDRFMDRGGRMVIFSSLPVDPNDLQPYDNGLEDYLKKYGVQLGRDYLLHPRSERWPWPFLTDARIARENTTEVASEFRRNRFRLGFIPMLGAYPTRTVKAAPAGGPQGDPHAGMRSGNWTGATLLEVEVEQEPVWAETDYKQLATPTRYLDMLRRTNAIAEKRAVDPIPVAVTVTDKDGKPRLVVFGDGAMATDVASRIGSPYAELFRSSVAWLAGRTSDLGIGPKRTDVYAMKKDDAARFNRMIWLPLWIGVVSLLGIGTGVWLVRRR